MRRTFDIVRLLLGLLVLGAMIYGVCEALWEAHGLAAFAGLVSLLPDFSALSEPLASMSVGHFVGLLVLTVFVTALATSLLVGKALDERLHRLNRD